jgi:hypothetical protein
MPHEALPIAALYTFVCGNSLTTNERVSFPRWSTGGSIRDLDGLLKCFQAGGHTRGEIVRQGLSLLDLEGEPTIDARENAGTFGMPLADIAN